MPSPKESCNTGDCRHCRPDRWSADGTFKKGRRMPPTTKTISKSLLKREAAMRGEELSGNADKLSRVQLMASGESGTWDLSPNDLAALQYVLESRAELLAACKTFIECAAIAHDYWDADQDMKVGKMIMAMSGHTKKYRADLTAAHDALSKANGETT